MEKLHRQIREPLNTFAGKAGTQTEQQLLNPETVRFLKKLQGQCRLVQYTFLQISYIKIVFFIVPIVLSVVGLVLLFHYKALRVIAFYRHIRPKNSKSSSHIYVRSADGLDHICKINKIKGKNGQKSIFKFQELTYQICNNEPLPLGIKLQQEIGEYLNVQFLRKGLCEQQIMDNTAIYGKNEHLVKTPPYQQFLIYYLIHPLMIIQYITCVPYFLQNNGFYAYLLIGSSLITIHINYFLMRKSYSKIRKIAEKTFTVRVLREGIERVINNADLVPGDLYFPDRQIPCDSIIMTKDIFVNQAGFTGQNIPIGKFALTSIQKLDDSHHWVYQGSEVISRKQNTLALAVTTGYSNRKGQIIRKILNPSPSSHQFFKNIIWLAIEVLIVNLALYAICFSYMFHDDIIDRKFIYLRIVDFTINSMPAVLQMFMNLLYTVNLIRLNTKGIIGTNPEKTIEGSRLQTLCFDKTGTLTENSVDIEEVILLQEKERKKINITEVKAYGILHRLFGTCHTVQVLNDGLHGDQIDLKMFRTAHSQFKASTDDNVIYDIIGESFELQVWKINQFQSKFQSMSVLVRDKKNGSMYIFVKGSPQMIHNYSIIKHENFGPLVKELSLEGYRTIAIGYKEIRNLQQFEQYLGYDRERYLQGISLIGLVTFTNKLKVDAKQIINTLHSAQIKVKMITGDNIFVAVQNALVLHLVPESQRIIVLEGSKVNSDGSMKAITVKTINGAILEKQIFIQNVDQHSWENQYLAMDFQFIKKKEQIFLTHDCVVFARATPEMKRIIIKKQKERLETNFNNRSWKDRTFGGRLRKVGMVGDGANDLMALREANIGIGISNSDAIYSANFTIQNLTQIDTILRQSKCAERKLTEMANFNSLIYSWNIIFFIFWTPDATMSSPIQQLIRNFLCIYPITILISLTPPAKKLTKYIPSSNMIGLENQLIYWGVWLINSGGLAVAYLNYKSSSDFEPNPDRSQINTVTKTSTVIFLMAVFLSSLLPISLSSSHPWKLGIWKNLPLFLIIIFDFVFVTAVLFNSKYCRFIDVLQIDFHAARQLYLIALSTVFLSIVYSTFIQQTKLYRSQYSFRKAQPNLKLKQFSHSIG